jgi:hypothetical protein
MFSLRSVTAFGARGGQLLCASFAGIAGVLGCVAVVSAQDAQNCIPLSNGAAETAAGICAELSPSLDLSVPAGVSAPVVEKNELPRDMQTSPTVATRPLPVAIVPSETGAVARTSLQVWRDYNNQMNQRKMDGVTVLAPPSLALPKAPVETKGTIDVWSSLDAHGFDSETGKTVRAGAGVNYPVSTNANIGVVAERASTNSGTADKTGSDDKLAAYVAFKASPVITIDARAQFENNSGSSPASPDKNAFFVAPRINKSFALDGGQTLEPYVTIKSEIDLAETAPKFGNSVPIDSAGAGVTLGKPDAYSLSVKTDVSGMGRAESPVINSGLEFKVPLK